MIMFGIQLCPAAVRISWGRLFPEDIDEEEVGRSFTIMGGRPDLFPSSQPQRSEERCETIPAKNAIVGAEGPANKRLSDIVVPLLMRGNSLATVSSEISFVGNRGVLTSTNMAGDEEAHVIPGISLNESKAGQRCPPARKMKHVKSAPQPMEQLAEDDPLRRTNLLPSINRPQHYPRVVAHQVVDSINSKSLSPLVQEYLRPTTETTGTWTHDKGARVPQPLSKGKPHLLPRTGMT